jgi:hypothetical protein
VAPTSRWSQAGTASELPYYAKPALVDFTGSSNTIVDQTGIDVIDNAGNTAAELSATLSPWVTLG